MAKLVWDQTGEKLFETGVEQVALYLLNSSGTYTNGVAWNGVTGITESPSGAEASSFYADNQKYADLRSMEEFGATITAYTYPDEFADCDGTAELTAGVGVRVGMQTRKTFGLAYKTKIGNDVDDQEHGYKLHLIYGATASPSEKDYGTVNDSPELVEFSWEIETNPVPVTGFKPTAHICIDSTKVDATELAAFEKTLYGDGTTSATLPLPDAVKEAFTKSVA